MSKESKKVVFIEPNVSEAQLFKRLLESGVPPSMNLHCVDSLPAGLEILLQGGIDAVLLDLTIPGVPGVEGLAKLQSASPKTPVVVLANRDQEALALKAVRQGAQDYVVKGEIEAASLTRTIQYAVERGKTLDAWETSHQLIDQVPQALYVYDGGEKEIVYCNHRFAELAGPDTPDDRTRRRPLEEIVHPDDLAQFHDRIERFALSQKRKLIRASFRLKQRDGSFLRLRTLERAWSDDGSCLPLIVGTAEESMEADEVSEESKMDSRVVRALMDLIPDRVYVKDLEGRFAFTNRTYAQFLAVKAGEPTTGRTEHDFLPDETAKQICEEDERVLAEGRSIFRRKEVQHCADETERCFLTSKTPLRDGNGKTAGLAVISEDATELFQAERSLEKAQRDLEEIRGKLSQFAKRSVAILQQQLGHIETNLQLLQGKSEEGLDPEAADLISNSLEKVRQADSFMRSALESAGHQVSEDPIEFEAPESPAEKKPAQAEEAGGDAKVSKVSEAGRHESQEQAGPWSQLLIAGPIAALLLLAVSYVMPLVGVFVGSVLGIGCVAWKAFQLSKKRTGEDEGLPEFNA